MSTTRVVPAWAASSAPSTFRGIPKLRAKSLPVPRGIVASSARFSGSTRTEPAGCLADRPVLADGDDELGAVLGGASARERSASKALAEERAFGEPEPAARGAISGQRRRVEPFAEAG